MALKVLGGDFPQNGAVVIDESFTRKVRGLRISTGFLSSVGYTAEEVVSVQQVTQENSRSLMSKAGWGAVGAVALGPVGLLAGLLGAGNRTSLVLAVEFKDGKRALIQGQSKEAVKVLALGFTA